MTGNKDSALDEDEYSEEAEFDELLDGDENDGEEPLDEAMPKLTLEGLAGGVQQAINSIVDGTTREFDRLNKEINMMKKDAGKAEGYMEGKLEEFDKRISNVKDRLLKIEKAIKKLAKRVKQ